MKLVLTRGLGPANTSLQHISWERNNRKGKKKKNVVAQLKRIENAEKMLGNIFRSGLGNLNKPLSGKSAAYNA